MDTLRPAGGLGAGSRAGPARTLGSGLPLSDSSRYGAGLVTASTATGPGLGCWADSGTAGSGGGGDRSWHQDRSDSVSSTLAAQARLASEPSTSDFVSLTTVGKIDLRDFQPLGSVSSTSSSGVHPLQGQHQHHQSHSPPQGHHPHRLPPVSQPYGGPVPPHMSSSGLEYGLCNPQEGDYANYSPGNYSDSSGSEQWWTPGEDTR